MSRRKSSMAQGRGGRGENKLASALLSNKSPTISMMNPFENEELRVMPVAQVAPVPGRNRALQDITDKISRALQDMEGLYDAKGTEDEMLNDISEHANSLEGGEMKYQLKSFVNRYKEMSTEISEANDEKEEVLSSLADWFCSLNMELTKLTDVDNFDVDTPSAANNMLNAKMGFGKLKRMNEEINSMGHSENDLADLKREKRELEKEVMMNFKEYQEAAARNEEQMKKEALESNAKVWKYAAGEICQMLHKVRDEGQDYLQELEVEVKKMGVMLDNQATILKQMESKLMEYKVMERRWQNDNIEVMQEKSKLKGRIRRMKEELKITRDSLGRYETVRKSPMIEEDEDEKSPPHRVSETKGGYTTQNVQNEAKLMSYKKQLEHQQQLNRTLNEKVDQVEVTLSTKEEQVAQLENDKVELMHQMKQASVRPDTRHLSDTSSEHLKRTVTLSISSLSGNVTGIKSPSPAEQVFEDSCCKCKCHTTNNQFESPKEPPSTSQPGADLQNQLQVSTAIVSVESQTDVDVIPLDTQTSQVGLMEQYKKDLLDMEMKLKKAEENITSLQRKLEKARQVQVQMQAQMQLQLEQQRNEYTADNRPEFSRKASIEPTLSVLGAENQLPVRNTSQLAKSKEPNIITEQFLDVETITIVGTDGDKKFCHRAMLTDPALDPLSSWTQALPKESPMSWRPPMPPLNWVNFDPTMTPGDTFNGQVSLPSGGLQSSINTTSSSSIGVQMMKGAQPSDVHSETKLCANFVESQWKRMAVGIRGYVDYTNTLVDREARLMAQANKNLRRHLSMTELSVLEQVLSEEASDIHDKRNEQQHYLEMFGMENNASKVQGDGKQLKADKDLFSDKNQDLPIEERVKQRIIEIGETAITTLKRTHDLVSETLNAQHKQYEHIFTAFNNKPRKLATIQSEELMLIEDYDACTSEPEETAEVRQSASNSTLQTSVSSTFALHGQTLPAKEQSTVNAREYSLHTESPQSSGVPEKTLTPNKEGLKVSLATVPKKGEIFLTTCDMKCKMEEVKDHAMPRRRVKPAPVNHSQLKNKMNRLLRNKTAFSPLAVGGLEHRSKQKTREVSSKEPHHVLKKKKKNFKYELPTDYFESYTLSDLSKGAEYLEMAQKRKGSSIAKKIDSFGLPHLAHELMESPLSDVTLDEALWDSSPDQKLPPILN